MVLKELIFNSFYFGGVVVINELILTIRNSISEEQNQFFQRTQAFASPTDMASSGVWENIILSKTPTFDGVCGKLTFTIFDNFAKGLLCLFNQSFC